MTIPSPFKLDASSGELTVGEFQTTFLPNMTVADLEKTKLYNSMAPFAIATYAIGYQLKPKVLSNGGWLYLTAAFRDDGLRRLGFGWGMLRGSWGFYEQTLTEFREQLCNYVAWLSAELGPSLPCSGRQAYRKRFLWGEVEASSDIRSNLPGIRASFTTA